MAPYESDESTTVATADGPSAARRRAARYAVPAAVTGVAAATIGLVPALASSGSPDLPRITAEQLVQNIAESDTEQLSGTVRINTDLGLPDLGGLESGLLAGAAGSGGGDGSAADPSARLTELASGTHTLRVAADGPERQKLSLLEDAAEYSVIHNGKDLWGYDSKSNEVYHSTTDEPAARSGRTGELPAMPKDFASEALKSVDDTTSVTVDGTARVAGRDAYKLVIKPKQSGTTVGAISIAVDAGTWTPLKFTLTPSSGGAAVLDVGFTRVDFAKPAASTFDFRPPKGAEVTEDGESGESGESGHGPEPTGDGRFEFDEGDLPPGVEEGFAEGAEGMKTIGEGWNTVVVLDTGGEGIPSGADLGDGAGAFGGFLDSLGDKASGKFGKGTVFKTRLINALVTDDGTVYVGAVTKDALVEAADSQR